MKAAFYGTPAEAVPSLRALAEIAEVVLVITRPDRPRGLSARVVTSTTSAMSQRDCSDGTASAGVP